MPPGNPSLHPHSAAAVDLVDAVHEGTITMTQRMQTQSARRPQRLADAVTVVELHLSSQRTQCARTPGVHMRMRAQFLHVLTEKGISILEGPSSLASEVEGLARRFGNRRLAQAAAEVEPHGE